MIKKCRSCGIEKPLEDFYRKDSGRFGRSGQCKPCILQKQKENKRPQETINRYYRKRTTENKALAVEYLGSKCNDCQGVFHPVVYDFHHTDNNSKDHNVGRLMKNSFDSIKPELDKCVLLCANCHRILHDKLRREKHGGY